MSTRNALASLGIHGISVAGHNWTIATSTSGVTTHKDSILASMGSPRRRLSSANCGGALETGCLLNFSALPIPPKLHCAPLLRTVICVRCVALQFRHGSSLLPLVNVPSDRTRRFLTCELRWRLAELAFCDTLRCGFSRTTTDSAATVAIVSNDVFKGNPVKAANPEVLPVLTLATQKLQEARCVGVQFTTAWISWCSKCLELFLIWPNDTLQTHTHHPTHSSVSRMATGSFVAVVLAQQFRCIHDLSHTPHSASCGRA